MPKLKNFIEINQNFRVKIQYQKSLNKKPSYKYFDTFQEAQTFYLTTNFEGQNIKSVSIESKNKDKIMTKNQQKLTDTYIRNLNQTNDFIHNLKMKVNKLTVKEVENCTQEDISNLELLTNQIKSILDNTKY